MALMDHVLKAGKNILLAGLKKHLFTTAKNRWLEVQKKNYEYNVALMMKERGVNREEVIKIIGDLVLDKADAEKRAHIDIDMGVGRRLEGAIACYGVGKQLECIRLILMALEEVARIEEMGEAAEYLSQQSAALYQDQRRKEEVRS